MAASPLAGARALVTGASRGVGRAIALALAAKEVEVLGTSRNPEAIAWPDGIAPLRFDMSNAASAQASWQRAGLSERPPDLVINNAGAGVFGPFPAAPWEAWDAQVQLLLLAPMKLCHLAVEAWSEAQRGCLVNVTSLAVDYPIPYMSGYNAAKAGLAAFSESLAQEGHGERIRMIELRLGDLRTEFNAAASRFGQTQRQQAAWEAMERHVSRSPHPELAARRLIRALEGGETGPIKVGSFFQATLGSFWARIVSPSAKRAANLAYYNLRSR